MGTRKHARIGTGRTRMMDSQDGRSTDRKIKRSSAARALTVTIRAWEEILRVMPSRNQGLRGGSTPKCPRKLPKRKSCQWRASCPQ